MELARVVLGTLATVLTEVNRTSGFGTAENGFAIVGMVLEPWMAWEVVLEA